MTEDEIRKLVRAELITTIMVLLRMLNDVMISGEDWGEKQLEWEEFWGR